MIIKSKQNKIFKDILNIKNKKKRKESGFFIIEGSKQIAEITKEWKIKALIISEQFKTKNIIENQNTFILSDQLFNKISSTETPQGILAIIEEKHYKISEILKQNGLFIILDNIQDPGNLGTIIRSADAFGAKAVIVSQGSADIYSEKTMRSTMGSFFHIPVIDKVNIESLLQDMKKENFNIYAASLKTKKGLKNLKFNQKSALLIGNEAQGLKPEIEKMADTLIKIEMSGQAESLNAAIAASIIMYEASVQKNHDM